MIEVEVVAEEDAARAIGAQPGDGRRVGQHLLLISRQGHNRFDGLYHLRHALELLRGDENGLRRKEVGTAFTNHR